VGKVKIPYYVTRKAWPGSRETLGYWSPCLARPNRRTGASEPTLMSKLGFKLVALGPDGPDAWAGAATWNRRWKAARAAYRAGRSVDLAEFTAHPPERERRVWPANSLGEAFTRFRATGSWLQAKQPRTRQDWWRGWDLIAPVFGDLDPATVSFEQLDLWYFGSAERAVAGLLETVGVREAHRAMKIWRALWVAASKIKRDDGRHYCVTDADPSLGVRRQTPMPRNLVWYEGEAVRLVKRAIRMRYYGLAAALGVAWDTAFAPVDLVALTVAQLATPPVIKDRTKTGEGAIGTVGKRTQRLLADYRATLPENLLGSAPIFYTRGAEAGPKGGRRWAGQPYTVNKLGKDFRDVRDAEFPGDKRTIGNDFRRSRALEVLAGDAPKGALNAKMANSMEESRELRRTYTPVQTAVVQLADAAAVRGRRALRGGGKEPK
jgi:hypothetical protein